MSKKHAWTDDDLSKMQSIIKGSDSVKLGIAEAAKDLKRKESSVSARYYSLNKGKKATKKRTEIVSAPAAKKRNVKRYVIEITNDDGTRRAPIIVDARMVVATEATVL